MIGEVENFLTEEEVSEIFNFISTNESWDITETHYNEDGTVIYDSGYWKDRVATARTLESASPKILEMVVNIIKRANPVINSFFNVEATPTSPALVRWLPGNLQMPHADKELHEGEDRGKPNDFPYYDLATVIYINDDYEGGELYFPNQDVKFKPKAGGMYFFPGDMNYIHGITEIKSGIRYTCPLFWTITSLGSRDS
jgi:hypothetical protein